MTFFRPLSHHIDLKVPAGLVRHLLGPFLVHISSSMRILHGKSSKGGRLPQVHSVKILLLNWVQ